MANLKKKKVDAPRNTSTGSNNGSSDKTKVRVPANETDEALIVSGTAAYPAGA